ncbi:protein NUCLEAR FUSION DEFECTIVE 4-like [Heracleum sosnowskyi]|uniref:Protein NUCLEAR FUSION DEFECTIVE 4-like n=1 Tax=Heracleum sosnowskyi TaxID=360622 RepID=A0AAD8M7D2_9APIA|nr:protein NUCLEAR FUSION DEFECTIVE 4-like [Heracleum sosnowskyi]
MIINNNKWLATSASIIIQSTAGSLYTFGIYSAAIKSSQSYSQQTLDTLSVFKDFGANTGIFSGLLYSSVTLNSGEWFGGPWVVLSVGAVLSFLGYFLMWLSVAGIIFQPPVMVMCLFMLLAAHGLTFVNTANVVTGVNNFADHRGTIVGIMKGFLGLSGAILIQVYQTIFMNRPFSYLLMLALLPSFNTIIFMCFVRMFNTNSVDEKKHLNRFSVVALLTAAYLMIAIIVENYFTLTLVAHIVILGALIILILTPFYIATEALHEDSSNTLSRYLVEENQLMNDPNQLDEGQIHCRQDPSGYYRVQSGENLNLFQAMRSSNFWFLFLATSCGMGSGLAVINNISQIGESLGYTKSETSTLVSLWSIWNFLGRFGAGYLSDYLLKTKGWARPLLMALTLLIMSGGHSMIASGLPGALYVGSVVVGVCYGSQWSLMPTIVSEIFGVVHLGTIFNTITIASPLGSYVLSVRVVGYIYDKEASIVGNSCTGTHCFMLSFIIMASTTLLGSFVALGLFFRTRTFYKQVILARLQHSVQ